VWSWGADRDAATWRTALSDDESAYVELQAGLFRNQETYAFLEPQESVRFTENWLPVRDLGGITRATVDAVLHMQRTEAGRLRLALDTTREIPDARILVTHAGGTLIDTKVSLSPREVWRAEISVPTAPAGSSSRIAKSRLISRPRPRFNSVLPPTIALRHRARAPRRSSSTPDRSMNWRAAGCPPCRLTEAAWRSTPAMSSCSRPPAGLPWRSDGRKRNEIPTP
jgi:hypothetical protein